MKTLKGMVQAFILVSPLLLLSVGYSAEHPGYIEAPERRTTGIGKFYMDREIFICYGSSGRRLAKSPRTHS